MPKHEVDDNGLPIDPQMHHLEDQVCQLAVEYRGAKTEEDTNKAIERYQDTLKQLIRLGWGDWLDYECSLPDRYLPEEYFRLVDELASSQAHKPGLT